MPRPEVDRRGIYLDYMALVGEYAEGDNSIDIMPADWPQWTEVATKYNQEVEKLIIECKKVSRFVL